MWSAPSDLGCRNSLHSPPAQAFDSRAEQLRRFLPHHLDSPHRLPEPRSCLGVVVGGKNCPMKADYVQRASTLARLYILHPNSGCSKVGSIGRDGTTSSDWLWPPPAFTTLAMLSMVLLASLLLTLPPKLLGSEACIVFPPGGHVDVYCLVHTVGGACIAATCYIPKLIVSILSREFTCLAKT